GAVKATVCISPINPQQDASATVVIKDKTGKTTRLPFTYYAERVDVDKAVLNFGLMTPGTPGTLSFLITNPLGRAVIIEKAELINRNPAFTVKSPTTFPITLAPGDSIRVVVEANPARPDQTYNDTVFVKLGCAEVKVPVSAETADPCVQIGDLDFGTMQVGQSAVRTLRISNDGGGIVTFNNPSGGAVLEWIRSMFTVSAADLARLAAARLARGEFVDITVTFTATETGEFRDTARLWASVRKCRDISYWIARVTSPGPQITGYDWLEQWIVKGVCPSPASINGTKNTTPEYVSEVYVYNTGDAPFDVDRVELRGPDSIYFQLDNSDPLKTIKRDDRILQFDTVSQSPKYFQRVIFRPGSDERPYSCDIVLVTKAGVEVKNTLRGIGIESHIAAPPTTDWGRNLYVAGAPGVQMTVTFRTENLTGLGSRPVTITGMQIVPNDPGSAGQFTIMNGGAIIGTTFPERSTFDVIVEYRPMAAADHGAELVLTGDFSPCDDSTATLVGKVYTLNSRPEGTAYGTLLTCFDDTKDIFVENDGSDTIVVYNVQKVNDAAGVFTAGAFVVPDTLGPNERLVIPVTFAPNAAGTFTANFEFDVRDLKGIEPVLANGQPVVATVSGSGTTVQGTAHIERSYKSMPGDRMTVEVVMDKAIPEAQVNELDFSLRFAHGMMQQEIDPNNMPALVAGTILDGWTVTFSPTPPVIDPADAKQTVIFLKMTAPAGQFLTGTGTMLKIPFVTFIGDTTSTELPFFLTPVGRLACADIVTTPGAAALDSVCGLNFRLISAFSTEYALRQNAPNPFNPTTEIGFALGLDAQTTLKVYDSKGSVVATLVDSYLKPGEYTVTWDASSMPSGLYYYRLESGHWSRTETMVLQK
ncbi:MAG TPA: choice-of-anchor D domain-containing protein, partial [Candidatus Kapabacteria bacterium]|nr:choice-of-anchor D domain-containing protein [Candidatus Kapabacteria bacterium]